MQVDGGHLLDVLIEGGMTHLVGLPDTISSALVDAVECHEDVRYVPVTREGEAFAVAAGLWVGGAEPVVVIQNTGLLESGDSLRGTAVRMGVPLLCLITYRGYATMAAAGLEPGLEPRSGALEQSALVRPDVDTTALLTEPTLRSWEIPTAFVDSREDLPTVIKMWERARLDSRPVAVLLRQRLLPC
jgi:sulfopyruvate decarboxylase TPP-binding subunit